MAKCVWCDRQFATGASLYCCARCRAEALEAKEQERLRAKRRAAESPGEIDFWSIVGWGLVFLGFVLYAWGKTYS